MTAHEIEMKVFEILNNVSNKGGTVIVGSSFMAQMPVNELKQTYTVDCNLYNRSVADLTVFEAEKHIKSCMDELKPSRILIQLGETDLERGYASVNEIADKIEAIVNTVKSCDKRCKIVLVSVIENQFHIQPTVLNRKIEAIAKQTKCQYADVTSAANRPCAITEVFRSLRLFMTDNISFANVMEAYGDTTPVSNEVKKTSTAKTKITIKPALSMT